MNQLILACILSFLPISELRGGIPVAVNYALNNNVELLPVFLLIIFCNLMVIFFVYFFMNLLHKYFLKLNWYNKIFESVLIRIRKKTDKLEKDFSVYGFLALTIFVAIPLPATGAWTGSLIAWVLDLDKKKSIAAISLGVLIAGTIMFIASITGLKLFFN